MEELIFEPDFASKNPCTSTVCGTHPRHHECLSDSSSSDRCPEWELSELRSLMPWLLCICVVDFDLVHGQKLKLVYPCDVLSAREKKSVSSLAFPDSHKHTGDDGNAIDAFFVFRFRADRYLTETVDDDFDDSDDSDLDDICTEESSRTPLTDTGSATGSHAPDCCLASDGSSTAIDSTVAIAAIQSDENETSLLSALLTPVSSEPTSVTWDTATASGIAQTQSDSSTHRRECHCDLDSAKSKAKKPSAKPSDFSEDKSCAIESEPMASDSTDDGCHYDWCATLRNDRRQSHLSSQQMSSTYFAKGTPVKSGSAAKKPPLAALPTATVLSDDGFLFGFAYFRRRKDSSLDRGYFQQSCVLISALPFLKVFESAVTCIAQQYFRHGSRVLDIACRDVISSWPLLKPPSKDSRVLSASPISSTASVQQPTEVRLPLLGSVIASRIDSDRLFQTPLKTHSCTSLLKSTSGSTSVSRTPALARMGSAPKAPTMLSPHRGRRALVAASDERSKSAVSLLSCASVCGGGGLFQEVNIFKYFHGCVKHLWLLWELVLCGYPILVEAQSVEECSQIVLCLVSLIAPVTYRGDYRPYFTIYDPDFKHFAELHDKGMLDTTADIASVRMPDTSSSVPLASAKKTKSDDASFAYLTNPFSAIAAAATAGLSSGGFIVMPESKKKKKGKKRSSMLGRVLLKGRSSKKKKGSSRQHAIILGVTNPLFRERTLEKFPNVLVVKESVTRTEHTLLSVTETDEDWLTVKKAATGSRVQSASSLSPASSLSSARSGVKLKACIKASMQPAKELLSQLIALPTCEYSSMASASDTLAAMDEICAINNLKIREYFVRLTMKVLTPLERFCKVRIPAAASKSIEVLMKGRSVADSFGKGKRKKHVHGSVSAADEWNPYLNPPLLADVIGDADERQKFLQKLKSDKEFAKQFEALRVVPLTGAKNVDALVRLFERFLESNNMLQWYAPYFAAAREWQRRVVERRVKSMCFACLVESRPLAEGRVMYGSIQSLLQQMAARRTADAFKDRSQLAADRALRADRTLAKALVQHLRILEKCGVRPQRSGASAHRWFKRLLKAD